MKEKIYLVWVPEVLDDDAGTVEGGYYNQFDTLEDAVEEANGEEVFEAAPKSLGYAKVETKITFTKRKAK